MTENKFFSLSAITNRIKQILEPHTKKLFWVKAEISSGRERGGSFYCDLVETDKDGDISAKMRCSIWSRNLASIRTQFKECDLDLKLDDGTVVGLQCALQYSSKYGLSLKVVGADPVFALGELELKKKQILDRLIKEGLLEPNKTRFVPMLPQKIGLISSKGSAAYNDFLKTLSSAPFGFKIYVADAIVQGDQTEKSVLNALETLENLDVELVVLVRGGGSKTDLFYLDNETIARRIAAYKLPVWTGIGHETDTSILDYVANRNFKTPTAIAEEIISRFVEMNRHIEEAKERFKSSWAYRLEMENRWITDARTGVKQGTRKLLDTTTSNLKNLANIMWTRISDRLGKENTKISVAKKVLSTAPVNTVILVEERLQNKKERYVKGCNRQLFGKIKDFDNLRKRFGFDRFNQRIRQEKRYVDDLREQLMRQTKTLVSIRTENFSYLKNRFKIEAVFSRIENERRLIRNKLATLKAFDPQTSLKRGFSLMYKEDGELLKSVAQTKIHETLKTQLSDGQITSIVTIIKEK